MPLIKAHGHNNILNYEVDILSKLDTISIEQIVCRTLSLESRHLPCNVQFSNMRYHFIQTHCVSIEYNNILK